MQSLIQWLRPISWGAFALSVTIFPWPFDEGNVIEISSHAYAQAQTQFARLIAGRSDQPPKGFKIIPRTVSIQGKLVQETNEVCRGGGLYLVRAQDVVGPPILITAPHRRADLFTGSIVLKLFHEQSAAAAAWNSVPRRKKGICGDNTGDLARITRHPFTAFSIGFASVYPSGRIVQIHGFNSRKRISWAAQKSSIILSSGSDRVTPAVAAIAECMRSQLPEYRVSVFPTDVDELGAKKNAQARELRSNGFQGFVHVELALPLRKELMEKADLRGAFGNCLEANI